MNSHERLLVYEVCFTCLLLLWVMCKPQARPQVNILLKDALEDALENVLLWAVVAFLLYLLKGAVNLVADRVLFPVDRAASREVEDTINTHISNSNSVPATPCVGMWSADVHSADKGYVSIAVNNGCYVVVVTL